tara:strand:+ start:579 stop:1553 length:975 start_codon:yes stop_codon:yes gene_type:complete
MQAATPSNEREALASRRRASKEITEGIEETIDDLHSLSDLQRVREVFFFVLLYAVGALLASSSDRFQAFFLVGVVCMGAALNSLAILIHDGLHGLLARNSKVNHLLSFLVGLPIGMSATAYQITHINHHYQLGRKLDFGTYRQHVKRRSLVWVAYVVQLFFGTILYVAFIPFLAFHVASRRSRLLILSEYGVILACYMILFSNLAFESILMYWVYPLIVMSMLTNIRGLASHALGDVENIYLSSRTVKSSKLVSLFFLHENYHLEHHLFPRVPSYNLSKIHALVWDRLPEALYSRSYSHFLLGLLKAALRNDMKPMGVIRPLDK